MLYQIRLFPIATLTAILIIVLGNSFAEATEPLFWNPLTYFTKGADEPEIEPSRFNDSAEIRYDRWQEYNVGLWKWQALPSGLIYPSYLAGRKESRLGISMTEQKDYGMLWDIALGGRAPLIRYGTTNTVLPEGWQLDLEGAALLRLDVKRNRDLAGTDYRAGVPLTYGTKHWQYKFAYYHVSSHLGDNYILEEFRLPRVQYVRDELVFGIAWRPTAAIRCYGEFGWAFYTGATTKPLEAQFGFEYSPIYEGSDNWHGSPFAAINGHVFEELDFGGYLNFQVGWQWRGPVNNLFRIGFEYYDGCDDQFQFHYDYVRKFGFGIWYDF